MVENGMTPMQAIFSATIATADLLDKTETLGTIEPGKLADIIAVDESPLDDISALKNISVVIKDGVLEYRR